MSVGNVTVTGKKTPNLPWVMTRLCFMTQWIERAAVGVWSVRRRPTNQRTVDMCGAQQLLVFQKIPSKIPFVQKSSAPADSVSDSLVNIRELKGQERKPELKRENSGGLKNNKRKCLSLWQTFSVSPQGLRICWRQILRTGTIRRSHWWDSLDLHNWTPPISSRHLWPRLERVVPRRRARGQQPARGFQLPGEDEFHCWPPAVSVLGRLSANRC